MKDDHSTSSAIPDNLYAYNSGVQNVDTDFRLGPAARVRAAMADFLASRPDYGGTDQPLDGLVRAHLDHSRELGAWVEAVATAFFESGSGRLLPSRVHDPEDPRWDGTALWTADDLALSAQLHADSPEAAATRTDASNLADRIEKDAGHLDAVRADMTELDQNSGDVIFTTAFFNRLGPALTLWLERQLIEFSHYERYAGDEFDPFSELLRPLDQALATATRGGGLTAEDHLAVGWESDLISSKWLRLCDLSNLLESGTYSSDFLVMVGRRVANSTDMDMAFNGYTNMISPRWPGVAWTTWDDPLVSILGAIGRDPEASVRLFADRQTANKLLDLPGDPGHQSLADVARAAIESGGGSCTDRSLAAFNVLAHFAGKGQAPAEIRHVLADLVVLHLDELGLDADVQGAGSSTLNADGTIYLTLADLHHVLRLATRDEADSGRVLDASSTWVSSLLAHGPVEQGTMRVGRWYGMLVRANETRVTDAAADDARRQQFMDSVDKVIGLIPVPGEGELAKVGGEGVKLLLGHVLKDAGGNTADAAAVNANAFNDDMVGRLDYLAAAAVFARDPEGMSDPVPAPVIVINGHISLAPPDLAGHDFQLWYAANEARFNAARAQVDAGYAVRKAEFAGK